MGLTRSSGYLTQWTSFKLDPSILGRFRVSIMKYPLDIGSHWVQNHLRFLLLLYASQPPSIAGTPAIVVILFFSWSRRSLVFTGASPNSLAGLGDPLFSLLKLIKAFRSGCFICFVDTSFWVWLLHPC